MDPGDVYVQRKKLQLWAQQGDGCLKQNRLTLKLPEMWGKSMLLYFLYKQSAVYHTQFSTENYRTC